MKTTDELYEELMDWRHLAAKLGQAKVQRESSVAMLALGVKRFLDNAGSTVSDEERGELAKLLSMHYLK